MASEIKCKFESTKINFKKGVTELVFSTKDMSKALQSYEDYKDTQVTVKVSKYRRKRSINANSYCWVLISKIAEKMQIKKDDVYKQYIKDIGVCRTIEVSENAVDTLKHSWSLHGIGWVVDVLDYSRNKGFVMLNLYYGSSTYNTKKMSQLIDAIVQDCKDLGIETKTPDEIERLKSLWESEKN